MVNFRMSSSSFVQVLTLRLEKLCRSLWFPKNLPIQKARGQFPGAGFEILAMMKLCR